MSFTTNACHTKMEQVRLSINDFDDVYVIHQQEKGIYELCARWNFQNGGPRVLKEYDYFYILSHHAHDIIKDMSDTRTLELL
jgi:hypothetical protein